MSMARPILASALDQIAEVLDDGSTALLVKPGDHVALAEGLRRLAENRMELRQLGLNARDEALAKYTWTKHVTVMLDSLYSATVQQRKVKA
jgi:glycosyltransferase involved in cell wall biosynthesis